MFIRLEDNISEIFSVIITTQNRHKLLERAFKSCVEQEVQAGELIVIDDGSEPPVDADQLRDLASNVPFRLLRCDVPLGVSAARNIGIDAANYEWLAFLDDDDTFSYRKLFCLAETIKNNRQVDLIYHTCRFVYVNENVGYTTRIKEGDPKLTQFQNLLVENVVGGTPMVALKREWAIKSGGFDERLSSLEDHEFWIRLAQQGANFHGIEEPLTICYCTTQLKSVTKSQSAGETNLNFINRQYSSDYSKLNLVSRYRYFLFRIRHLIYFDVVRYKHLSAFLRCCKLFLFCPSLKNLALALISIFGARWIIIARSKFAP